MNNLAYIIADVIVAILAIEACFFIAHTYLTVKAQFEARADDDSPIIAGLALIAIVALTLVFFGVIGFLRR